MKTQESRSDSCRVRLEFPSATSDLGSSLETTGTTVETTTETTPETSSSALNVLNVDVENELESSSDTSAGGPNEVLSVLAPPARLSTTLLDPVDVGTYKIEEYFSFIFPFL